MTAMPMPMPPPGDETLISIRRLGAEHIVGLPNKSAEQRARMRLRKNARDGFMDPRPNGRSRLRPPEEVVPEAADEPNLP